MKGSCTNTESTQAEPCTQFIPCCKTYCNTAGSCTLHLPPISAYRHQQHCYPDHIMLQHFGPHSALGHCQVTEVSLTVCTVKEVFQ